MKLIFEKSVPGRRCTILPSCDVETAALPESLRRSDKPDLPQLSETDISRHYTELCHQVHGVNCGFYPLGSCTMKYNPRINEEMAALPGSPWPVCAMCWTPPGNISAKSPAWTA